MSNESWAWQSPLPEELDALVPDLRVHRRIGRGGMGAVYQATQTRLDREIALKLLPEQLGQDPEFAARFEREARIMGQLVHPNILPVFDFGKTSAGHRYYLAEFFPDGNLGERMKRGEMSLACRVAIFCQICDGVAFAHDRGLVHRDLKPANVLCGDGDFVKVADFGLAKMVIADGLRATEQFGLTNSRVALGSPDYASPEQMDAAPVDHRTDIFSLGVILYEMLTGSLPRGYFRAASSLNPHVPTAIDGVIEQAMQVNPDDRFLSVGEFRAKVRVAMSGVASDKDAFVSGPSEYHAADAPTAISLPKPVFPPRRPEVRCRLAVIPVSEDLPSPPFQWLPDVEAKNYDDLVQLAKPSTASHKRLVALRAGGEVCTFCEAGNSAGESDAVYVMASPSVSLTQEGKLSATGARIPPISEQLAELRCANDFALGLSESGRVIGIGNSLNWLNEKSHTDKLVEGVQIEASLSGHAAVLHRDGRITEILAANQKRELREVEGARFQRLVSDEFAIDAAGKLVTIAIESPPAIELGELLANEDPSQLESIETRAAWAFVRRRNGTWLVFLRDQTTGGVFRGIGGGLADALFGATTVYGQNTDHVGRLGHVVALFPSEQLPKSGVWQVDRLLAAKSV